jgi:hypothetical protein
MQRLLPVALFVAAVVTGVLVPGIVSAEPENSINLGIGARYYSGGSMKGLSIGGVAGYWMTDWRFIHNRGRSNEVQGAGDSDSFRVNIDIGDRFPIGSSSFSIMPALNLGKFFSSTSCDYTAPAS